MSEDSSLTPNDEPLSGNVDQPTPPPSGCGGCLIPIVVVFGLFFVWFLFSLFSGGSDRAPDEFDARVQCQEWVKGKLKSPSSAEFSNVSASSTGSQSWSVTGEVDAQNSFGAQIRSSWSCTIRVEGDLWRGGAVIHE